MRIHYDAGATGLTTVGYTIYNADGTVHTARNTAGITEEPGGSGSYGATVADTTLIGRTVVWDNGPGTIGGSETFMDLAAILSTMMGGTGELYVGTGLGIVHYQDTLTGVNDEPIAKALIRVFPYENNLADFTVCKGRTITEPDGQFDLWLDPGTYVMRVEKVSTLVMTKTFTVSAPQPALGVNVQDTAGTSESYG